MRIFVDLDNSVAETTKHEMNYSRILFPNYGLYPMLYNKELVTVNSFRRLLLMENGTLLDHEIEKCVNSVYENEKFWETIPVVKNSQMVLKEIQDKFGEGSVIFATSTFDFGGENKVYDGCITGKVKWIKNNFPFINTRNIIYTGYKWLLKGDYLIEDNFEQLSEFKGKKILIDFPYNRGCKQKDVIRVNDWNEIRRIILG